MIKTKHNSQTWQVRPIGVVLTINDSSDIAMWGHDQFLPGKSMGFPHDWVSTINQFLIDQGFGNGGI
jgi:hypothetical protein